MIAAQQLHYSFEPHLEFRGELLVGALKCGHFLSVLDHDGLQTLTPLALNLPNGEQNIMYGSQSVNCKRRTATNQPTDTRQSINKLLGDAPRGFSFKLEKKE